MELGKIDLPMDKIADFCQRWKVAEFALFGSVLRDDFRSDSDVDVLVSFQPDAAKSMDAWLDMIEELKAIFGREIDLVERQFLRNPFRRHRILTTAKVIYAA